MFTVYHNPQCRKSREGLKYLQGKGVELKIVEYLKNPITVREFEKLLVKLNKKPQDLIRTQEVYFKHNLKGKKFEDHEWIKILLENPKLIQRPIVETQYRAVVGDPLENIDFIMK